MNDLEAINRRLNAITAWAPRMAAVEGALSGLTVAVKANIDVAGLATTAGMACRREAMALGDAPVVARLRAAGAIILGHANMDEAGLGAVTDNPFWGRTENPLRRGRTTGGSSGGSAAAVSGGLARLALGADTLRWVRIPAAYTGIFGLKPGRGVLSGEGVVPLLAQLDVPGVMAAQIEDLAAAWDVLVPAQHLVPVVRVAVLADVQAATMAPAVRAGLETMLILARAMGLKVETRPFSGLCLREARLCGFWEAVSEAGRRFGGDAVSPRLARLFAKAADASEGAAAMARARDIVLGALQVVDAIILPTAPQTAFAHGEIHADQVDFCALASLAGVPALSVPAGVDLDGMPVGVQFIGRPGNEAGLIALARQLLACWPEPRREI